MPEAVGLPVYQPQSFREEQTVQQLRELKPDLLVVVAYGKILPQAVLDIPTHGAINMHGSILPELRGSAPVQRSILNHCDEAGVTAMYLSAGMDEGDIIEIRKTVIQPLETSEELMARLARIAAPLCADTVRAIENGTAKRIPQDPSRATYAPMLRKDESPIDWDQPARFIVDQVRGLVPWPVATATLGGTEFKIYRVEYTDQKTEKAPGALVALTKEGPARRLPRRRRGARPRAPGPRRQTHARPRLLPRPPDHDLTTSKPSPTEGEGGHGGQPWNGMRWVQLRLRNAVHLISQPPADSFPS